MSVTSSSKSTDNFATCLQDQLGITVRRLVADSRELLPGDTFVAYAGERYDARQDIPRAITLGVNAVIWEKQGYAWNPAWQLPNLAVTGLRHKAGQLASQIYGHPSRQLWLVGITGTNGKTSCSHWYAQAMTALGKKTAVIGTLGHGFSDALSHSAYTTPDAMQLQQLLAECLQQDAQSIAMEVSSHGLAQGRVIGSEFSVAVLTNLSRDHLDYHGSMDAYAATKAKLFFWHGLKRAVLNLDEVLGVELSRQLAGSNLPLIGYGFQQPRQDSWTAKNQQILYGSNLQVTAHNIAFDVEYCGQRARLQSNVTGRFNAYNLLAVLATLLASDIALEDAVAALQTVRPIAGRMEKLGGGSQPTVIVDYAHTPHALCEVLTGLREMLNGARTGNATRNKRPKLICVIGCGGDRDQGKRPLIGEIVSRLADEVIITSDNPRNEPPHDIIRDIMQGVHGGRCAIEADRAAAIYRAIHSARPGDVVLIAGKGAEAHQEIAGKKHPFDDREVARQVLHDLANLNLQVQG
ncbi:UDP-N-acetylmuramoyl-L-alanyl-D-glutamate--2,6-diaminopimelate ligase [Nitrosomonas sp. ANs5]|uniref:UDP-N-acetylmuramoyl-L-alanyl-D-glutamate--2, 6-diaminopimelate ligase n=1 Tax=Nitrosomonas sp. ANs5 TaxID=3423941 RepID=UPI003D343CB4